MQEATSELLDGRLRVKTSAACLHCNPNTLCEDKQKGHTGQDDTASGIEVHNIAVHRTEVDEGHVENREELPE